MQSWGTTSRYKQRATDAMPTKSGVLGLIASAQGRRRTDPLEDLADLFSRFAWINRALCCVTIRPLRTGELGKLRT